MEEQAYDLDTFAPRGAATQPGIRVVKGGKPHKKVREGMHMIRVVATTALILGLIFSLLYSQATITELITDIQSTQNDLNEAQSLYDYNISQLSAKTNLKTVEEVVTSRLGLMKLDKSQITYISLEKESVIERPESPSQKLLGGLRSAALSIAAVFAP